jgi:hypothetical protein
MTTMDITLLSMLGIQWTIAYFAGRWSYRRGKSSMGFLWVPGLGLFLEVVFGGLLAVEYMSSDGFKSRFYGRPKPPKAEHVTRIPVQELTIMVNMYTCHGLVAAHSDFGTATRVWRNTYASNPL